MSRKKYKTINLDLVIDRIKKRYKFTKQEEVAELLGLSASDLSQRKKSKTLINKITEWAINENINLDRLLNPKVGAVRDVDETYSEDQITRDTAMQIILDMNKTLMARDDQLIEEIRKTEVENAEIKARLRFVMESLDKEERPNGLEERRKIWKTLKRGVI